MPSGRFLICFAVSEEAAVFKSFQVPNADILITGMGMENAKQSLSRYLESAQPSFVVSSGFSGGLNPRFSAKSLIFETKDSSLKAACRKTSAKEGTSHTINYVCSSVAGKSRLFLETKKDAVDMESASLDSICTSRGIPFLRFRIISDAANEDLPLDFNKFITSDCRMNLGKLVMHVLLHPAKIPRLLKFQKRIKKCGNLLGLGLKNLVSIEVRQA